MQYLFIPFDSLFFSILRPGTDAEIKDHVTSKYGVTFDLFSKIRVNGGRAHPLWKFLTSQKGGVILWNFTKFLIDKNGAVVKRWERRKERLLTWLTLA